MAEFTESDARLLRELMEKKRTAESAAENAANKGPTCKFHLANGDKIEVPFPKAREILMSKYGWSEDDFGDDVRAADRESGAMLNRLTGE